MPDKKLKVYLCTLDSERCPNNGKVFICDSGGFSVYKFCSLGKSVECIHKSLYEMSKIVEPKGDKPNV